MGRWREAPDTFPLAGTWPQLLPIYGEVARSAGHVPPRGNLAPTPPHLWGGGAKRRRDNYPVVLTYQSVTYWNRSYGSIALFVCTPCTRWETAYS
jgi:hypothetical protein